MSSITLKVCAECANEKTVSHYRERPKYRDGLSSVCDDCAKIGATEKITEKKCNACNEFKNITDYAKCVASPDKLGYKCKPCSKDYNKKMKEKLKDGRDDLIPEEDAKNNIRVCSGCQISQPLTNYYKNNKCINGYYRDCKKCHKERHDRNATPEKNRKRDKAYRERHPEKMKEKNRKRREQNVQYRLKSNLSRRIRAALEGKGRKSIRTIVLLGCDMDEFEAWIEFQFTEGYTWGNYGTHWNFDHVYPCAEFNLEDIEEQKVCFHWSNIQPLQKTENYVKGNKIDKELIESHKKISTEYAVKNNLAFWL